LNDLEGRSAVARLTFTNEIRRTFAQHSARF